MAVRVLDILPSWGIHFWALGLEIDTLLRDNWHRRTRSFLGILRSIGCAVGYTLLAVCALLAGWRFRTLFAAYAWFRRIDEVIDGESPPPHGMTNETYLKHKEALIAAVRNGNFTSQQLLLPEDILFLAASRALTCHGIDANYEITTIWRAITFDYERRKRKTLICEWNLIDHATHQDAAILSFVAKVLDASLVRLQSSASLFQGVFTRTDWLYDMLYDLKSGLVNISKEAAQHFKIDVDAFSRCSSWEDVFVTEGFKPWYSQEVERLSARWGRVRYELAHDFGGVSESYLHRLIFKRGLAFFEGAFQKSVLRLQIY